MLLPFAHDSYVLLYRFCRISVINSFVSQYCTPQVASIYKNFLFLFSSKVPHRYYLVPHSLIKF